MMLKSDKMAQTEIYQTLTEIFRDVFQRQDLVITPEMSAKDLEGWDSFKQIEIIMETEGRFSIRLTTRDLDSLQNVNGLVQVIAARTKK